MISLLNEIETKIIQALEYRPLSDEELINHTGVSIDELREALFHMRTQKMWVEKHQVIGNGCTNCACNVTYKWRLTIGGRQELKNKCSSNKTTMISR